MFLYNIKINSKRLLRFSFILMLIIIFLIFSIAFYRIFLNKSDYQQTSENITLDDSIKTDYVFEIKNENYATILQTVTDNVDSYIGCKIHYIGYIYRLIDFNKTEFVLARNMLVNNTTNQSLIIGFLCSFENADQFADDTWVDVTGTIEKGNYYGDIAQIKVENMFQCEKPENEYVSEPDDTYVPTSSML